MEEKIDSTEKYIIEAFKRNVKISAFYLNFSFKHTKATEYAMHGFCRRCGIIKACIRNIFKIYPPSRHDVPTTKEIHDLTINLQTCVLNVYGCIDNLAWVWAYESGFDTKHRSKIVLSNKEGKDSLLKTLSTDFQNYWESCTQEWFDNYMGDFRDALVHRIPFYIPPYRVDPKNEDKYKELHIKKAKARSEHNFVEFDKIEKEIESLHFFLPAYRHSFDECENEIELYQFIADLNTISELAEKMCIEIKSINNSDVSYIESLANYYECLENTDALTYI